MSDTDNITYPLSEATKDEIRSALGLSIGTELFIRSAQSAIWLIHTLDPMEFRTPGARKVELEHIKTASDALLGALSSVRAVFFQGINSRNKKDMVEYAKPNVALKFKIEDSWRALVQDQAWDMTDHTEELALNLEKLSSACERAIQQSDQPKPGSPPEKEMKIQALEGQICRSYREAYGCFPAQTSGNQFQAVMDICYREANFPQARSNVCQRTFKAIKRDRLIFESARESLEKLKPIRGLHPKKDQQ